MSQVTPCGVGHTLRVKPTHELGHPIEQVAPWVQSVPIKSLDFSRSNHVASHESYMTLSAYHGLQCSIMAINFVTPCNPTVPITLINVTLCLLHSISTQRDTSFGGSWISLTYNSWSTLDHLHLVHFLSFQLSLETLRLPFPTKSSHQTLGFLTPS